MGSSPLANELEEELKEAGNKLSTPPPSINELLDLLDKVEHLLSMVGQAPSSSMQVALVPSMGALISAELLRHSDADVKVSVASCLSEITRITAPVSPYKDEIMKEIFEINVMAFGKLPLASGHCFSKASHILESVANVKSSLMMLDLECDALILEMFQQFFISIRSDHPHDIFLNMETIMVLVIEESEELSPGLLSLLLSYLKKDVQNLSPIPWKLAQKVTKKCADKIKPYILKLVKSADLDPDSYAGVVAYIINDASTRKARVASDLSKVVIGEFDLLADERKNALVISNSAKTIKRGLKKKRQTDVGTTNASPSEILDVPEKDESIPKKRQRKSNSLLKECEGYDNLLSKEKEKRTKKKITFLQKSSTSEAPNSGKETKPVTLKKHNFADERNSIMIRRKMKACMLSEGRTGVLRADIEERALHSGVIASQVKSKGTVVSKSKSKKGSQKIDCSTKTPPVLTSFSIKEEYEDFSGPEGTEESVTRFDKNGSEEFGEELVGRRIRVWWPLDKRFYEGAIFSFDPAEKKHKVLYADGDEETLNLCEERWDLLRDKLPDQEPTTDVMNPISLADKGCSFVTVSGVEAARGAIRSEDGASNHLVGTSGLGRTEKPANEQETEKQRNFPSKELFGEKKEGGSTDSFRADGNEDRSEKRRRRIVRAGQLVSQT